MHREEIEEVERPRGTWRFNVVRMARGKEWVSCRDILWCLVFCGFAINYILRINLNLAIIAMVIPRPQAAAAAECDNGSKVNVWTNTTSMENVTSSPLPLSTTLPSRSISYEDRFAWNEYEQELALGAYYWLHWVTQLPGGLLARRYGTKIVFGWGNFFTALLGFLAPYATHCHLYAFVFLRALQGLIAGIVWPSMHDMTAKWIPPNERSKFVSAYLGSSVGAAITYPLCSAVINWFGWEAVFYVTSVLGVIWYIFWYFLAFDSPQQHPSISDEEKNYIIESLSSSMKQNKNTVPWKAILTSGPVWATIAAQWGGVWGLLTLMTQAPSYFNYVHGWNIGAIGILSGLPHVMRMLFSYAFSTICDWLLRTRKMSHTNVRKLATFMCSGGQGILTLGLGLSGCQPVLAVVFMMVATAANGAVSAGPLANFVDLSPNYASILLGLSGMVTIGAGFISPLIVGILTNDNQTIEQWRMVFVIAALMLAGSCVCYMVFGTSEQQPWDNPEEHDEERCEELQQLNTKQRDKTNGKTANGTPVDHKTQEQEEEQQENGQHES